MERRSILLVGNHFSGASKTQGTQEELAQKLSLLGWRVYVVSHKVNRVWRLADMLLTIGLQKKTYALAVVDVFSGPAFLWAEAVCQLLQLLRKPFILSLHGGGLPGFAKCWPGRVRRLLAKAEIVRTPSSYLLTQMRLYRPDLTLLPNAIRLEQYPFHLRQQPQPRLVWLRAFHEIYNPALAPRVMAQLKKDFPDIELIMFGPDQGDGSLLRARQVAVGLGVASSIEFPGVIPKTNVPAGLNQGDIFLNTTNIDNTPISVLEALACGLCVVSTNVGGVPYLLENGVDALLVPPNDADAMAKAVQRILTEPGLAEKLSRNARQKAERFDWSVILPQWERLIEQVQVTK